MNYICTYLLVEQRLHSHMCYADVVYPTSAVIYNYVVCGPVIRYNFTTVMS